MSEVGTALRTALISVLLTILSSAVIAESEVTQGEALYEQWCWQCHGKTNPHGSGTWALEKRPEDTRSPYIEDRKGLNEAYIRYVVRNGQLFMPPFRYTEISEEELSTIIAYLLKAQAESEQEK